MRVMKPVRTRFAPSPTGALHVGGVRTALYSWLYARHCGGEFMVRLEDTDRQRSRVEFEADILAGLEWLGLRADVEPVRQSERQSRYVEVVESLLASGRAYRCYCSREELEQMRQEAMARGAKPRYDGRCRERRPLAGVDAVVRLRNPDGGEVVVDDLLQGRVVYRNEELDDLILLRSDGMPTYHLTVVADDMDMGITTVIRGDDHLNNTPRQLNLFAALGAVPPDYVHVPLILGADGSRLSKRHGATGVGWFREQGYLPEALLNYLVRLGWAAGDRELYSPDELVQHFTLSGLNRSAARFDLQKLDWCNRQHMLRLPVAELQERLVPYLAERPTGQLVAVLRERESTLTGLAAHIQIFLRGPEGYEPGDARKFLTRETAPVLQALHGLLAACAEWSAPQLLELLRGYAAASGLSMGRVAQPLRVALCGRSASPPIDVTLELVGRDATLERLLAALGEASK